MAEEKKSKNVPVKAVTAVKKDDTKPGFFKRVGKWFRDMRSELKKIVWPTSKVLVKNTTIVLGTILLAAVVLWGFDYVAQILVKTLISIAG